MRISDWSSDVCSSDLPAFAGMTESGPWRPLAFQRHIAYISFPCTTTFPSPPPMPAHRLPSATARSSCTMRRALPGCARRGGWRSEEHTSELQSLMRISYAVFCLKKKKINSTQMPKHMTDHEKYPH